MHARSCSPAGHFLRVALLLCLGLTFTGCGGPSEREYKNCRELEAVLTAVSLRNPKHLEKDARRVDGRHASGELSDASYKQLMEIIDRARGGDWSGAEKQAYEFREKNPFFN